MTVWGTAASRRRCGSFVPQNPPPASASANLRVPAKPAAAGGPQSEPHSQFPRTRSVGEVNPGQPLPRVPVPVTAPAQTGVNAVHDRDVRARIAVRAPRSTGLEAGAFEHLPRVKREGGRQFGGGRSRAGQTAHRQRRQKDRIHPVWMPASGEGFTRRQKALNSGRQATAVMVPPGRLPEIVRASGRRSGRGHEGCGSRRPGPRSECRGSLCRHPLCRSPRRARHPRPASLFCPSPRSGTSPTG